MKNNELWLINTEVNVCEIKKNEDIIIVVDKYCGPQATQVQYFAYMHIAALSSCVSSLLSTFRLFLAFLGYAECFVLPHQAFFSYGEPFSALPSIFLPC